ncbi:Na/Pi cotransporter family protein [Chengkuizengella axinellae]|uniref:Na/Pi cotransporter family protein n=1 Tax=Chengkuizengella axinellae TaxID=3064388 RepID=A0ABT9J1W4_9BACL|nr:Na/Pi cotransporter family protein [Chengkuizengella sp. 2205SS18-9]MDP5275605.1 Na/Pi cotransporter family protein [Chengkuizengella sp. 2205SS18-9]
MDWQDLIFKFVGGLGIFLFGLKYMSEGLQKTAGDKLRSLLAKYTTNPILGVIVGIVVTILIQSSSGTTVLAVGLVNAGLMTLRQSIGVIMGANIGTTMTAFIIAGVKIQNYALPIIAVGVFLIFFLKKKLYNYIGQVIFGFGMLFYGLKTMGSGVKPLKDLEVFKEFIINLDNPILGVIVGTIFTVVVQSSSATIGILQTIASEGLISIERALPVLFGDNIGTTVTAIIASLGASVAAKRAAAAHVIFNIIGATIFLFLIGPVTNLILWLGNSTGASVEMQIAYGHGFFNITNTLIQLPFVGLLAYIVTRIVPGEMKVLEFEAKYLDERLLSNPSVGLGQAQHEIIRMGELAKESLQEAADYFFNQNDKSKNMVEQTEELINELDKRTTEYLVKIQQNELSEKESGKASVLMQAINDIERIGDHSENIMELADLSILKKAEFSDEARSELKQMIELTDITIQQSIECLENEDKNLAEKVLENEAKLDEMEKRFRKAHIKRLNQNLCSGTSGAVFLDILSNLERMGDHSKNIAQYVIFGE